MDFSGDVKAAIMRLTVGVGGGAGVRTPELLRGWREFQRSAAPARFLCFQDGVWVDIAGEAAVQLRRAFKDRRAMAEAACGGRAYLFDFLRMVRIDAAIGEETALAWIDDRGECFFPAPDCAGRKRKRDYEPTEDEAESSSSDELSGESRGVDAAKKRKAESGASGCAAARLVENDKYFQVVSKLFLSCGMVQRGAVITAVRKIAQGARAKAFQQQGQLLAAARGSGAGTAKFAWYGAASAEDVAAVVERGFVRTNAPRLGARKHGDGLHLSPPQCPYTSAMLAKADGSGEAHIVLCRVLMGQPEVVPAGSSQSRPSSDNYDSAVDKLENPQWYVVWSKDMNARILPEYVVSFKCPNLKPTQGSSEATSKPSSPVARDMFPMLVAEIEQLVPDKCDLLKENYRNYKMGQIKKEDFIRFLRNHIGDEVLTIVARKLRGRY